MWREGAEIVLFTVGIIRTSQESLFSIMIGGAAGTTIAGIIGVLLYLGLLKFSAKHLFAVTSLLLTLLASGMSAGVAGFLLAADKLPALGQAWDSSAILTQNSVLGKILHAMFGYSERPDYMQLIFYAATFAIIFFLEKFFSPHKQKPSKDYQHKMA